MLRVEEVYEKQVKRLQEKPDGTEIAVFEKVLETRESLVNTDYVVAVQPYEFNSSRGERLASEAFAEGTKFSTFVMDGNSFRKSEVIVVGSFDKYCRLLGDKQA